MYFVNRILKPEEVGDIVIPLLKVIIQSYTLTSWEDTDYMKLAISQALEIIDKSKDVILLHKDVKVSSKGNGQGGGSESFKKKNKVN
jgi:hypothetical protein